MEQHDIEEAIIAAEYKLREPTSPGEFNRYLETQIYTIGRRTMERYTYILRAFQRQEKPIMGFLSDHRARIYLAAIKKALLCFNFRELSHEDIFRGKKQPTQRMAPDTTREQRERILLAIGNGKHQLMAMIQHDTGCRAAEVVNLKPGQQKAGEDGRIKLHLITKGMKEADKYLSLGTSLLLDEYVKGYAGGEYLFWNPESIKFHTAYTQYRDSVKKAARSIGLANFCTHAFRFGLAGDLFEDGATVVDVKEALGHSSVATTQIYLQGTARSSLENIKKIREGGK